MTQTWFSRDEAIQNRSTLDETLIQTLCNIDVLKNAWLIDLEELPKVVELDHFIRLPCTQRIDRPRRMVCSTS